MTTTAQMLMMSGASVPTTQVGQFVLNIPNAPYGRFANTPNARVFLDYLDVIWDRSQADAQSILNAATRRGVTRIIVGPIIANGYVDPISGVQCYPNVDWRGRAPKLTQFLRWLHRNGVDFTFVLYPDMAPYWNGNDDGPDMDYISAAFGPMFADAGLNAILNRVGSELMNAWEVFTYTWKFEPMWKMARAYFPTPKVFYHNYNGHMWPGDGSEAEDYCCHHFIKHGGSGLYLQVFPIVAEEPVRDLRTIVYAHEDSRNQSERGIYDNWDATRRAEGTDPSGIADSPWGGPLVTLTGDPFEVKLAEGSAFKIHDGTLPDTAGVYFNRIHRAINGNVILDGLPR